MKQDSPYSTHYQSLLLLSWTMIPSSHSFGWALWWRSARRTIASVYLLAGSVVEVVSVSVFVIGNA